MKSLSKFKNPFLLIFFLLITGCGMWQDFTTYFNLYFNTTKSFEEALAEIQATEKDLFQLKEPDFNSTVTKNLDNVIERGSKILQHEAESSYFDDALYMTGVAFYYKQSYAKGIRKFKELAAQDQNDYKLKSRLWIAKCELQLRNFENGLNILEELKEDAIEEENNEVLIDTYISQVALHIDRQNYSRALSEASELLEITDDSELKSNVAYNIGMLRLDLGDTEEAAAAFETALEYSPDFVTEFKSKFELAKLKKELGNRAESYEMFDDLYNEGKYSEYWGDVYYEIGLLEYEDGNVERAFDIFTEVDTVYSKSQGAGRAQLIMGEIMRNEFADYDSAKFYYDKVQNSPASQEIKEQAKLLSSSIDEYMNLKSSIVKTDRQMDYIQNPDAFLIDSLAYQRHLVNLKKQQEEELNSRPGNRLQNNAANETEEEDETENESEEAVIDSVNQAAASDTLIAQTEYNFEIDEDYIVTEKPERPTFGIDTLESEQAANYFELGNLFFVDYQRLDSAYYYYSKLLNEFEETPNKARVLFALGTYNESTGDLQKADSLYSIVYNEYKTQSIANEAAKKLDKPLLIIEEDPAKDLFLEAEKELDSLNTDEALALLSEITEKYPESIYAPKSIYTKGWIFENVNHQPDSAVTMYAKLVDGFKNSEYAKDVRNKVSLYMTERQKRVSSEDSSAASGETGNMIEKETELPPATEEVEASDEGEVNVTGQSEDGQDENSTEETSSAAVINPVTNQQIGNDTLKTFPSDTSTGKDVEQKPTENKDKPEKTPSAAIINPVTNQQIGKDTLKVFPPDSSAIQDSSLTKTD